MPKHTAMQETAHESGVFALAFAEHVARYAEPSRFNQKHISMWKTKITVDLVLKHVPVLYRVPI